MKTFQKDRRVKELQAKVETARAEMLALQAAFDLEQSKVEKLERRSRAASYTPPATASWPTRANPPGRPGPGRRSP